MSHSAAFKLCLILNRSAEGSSAKSSLPMVCDSDRMIAGLALEDCQGLGAAIVFLHVSSLSYKASLFELRQWCTAVFRFHLALRT